jgi:Na+(H+)/acetate symporter ActP
MTVVTVVAVVTVVTVVAGVTGSVTVVTVVTVVAVVVVIVATHRYIHRLLWQFASNSSQLSVQATLLSSFSANNAMLAPTCNACSETQPLGLPWKATTQQQLWDL